MVTRKQKRKISKQKNSSYQENTQKHPVAKKSLGQNFLQEDKYLKTIVSAANLMEDENVVEIGPGTGFLTDQILLSTKNVSCIEKDERMVEFLQDKYGKLKNVPDILSEDILNLNLPAFLNDRKISSYKVVANIPYYITGKIIRLFLETEQFPDSLVLMVQKEVAERICSEPGSMSILSVSVQYFGAVEIIEIVPKEAFDPIPKVDSAVIRIVPNKKERESLKKRQSFFRVVKSGFSSPRKKLFNNLVASLKLEKNILQNTFLKLELDENIRAQNLSVEQWKGLRNEVEKYA